MDLPGPRKKHRRSTPHRSTGCLTCRQRRVRCDEKRPLCSNCVRLSLRCHFDRPPASESPPRESVIRVQMAMSPLSQSQSRRLDSIPNANMEANRASPSGLRNGDLPSTLSNGVGFCFDDWIGDIGSSWIDEERREPLDQNSLVLPLSTNDLLPTVAVDISGIPLQGTDSESLTVHFQTNTVPAPIVVTNSRDWTIFCQTFTGPYPSLQAALYLQQAMNAMAGMHRAILDLQSSTNAFQSYELACQMVNSFFDEAVIGATDRVGLESELQQAFAAVFLLMTFEFTAPALLGGEQCPPTQICLCRQRIIQFREQTRCWTGIFSRVLEWIVLLESKAIWLGGWGHDHFKDIIFSSDQTNTNTGDIRLSKPSNVSSAALTSLPDIRSLADRAIDSIRESARFFVLEAQQLMARIIALDRWHLNRGSVDMEYEVLKKGYQIRDSLKSLGSRCPHIFEAIDSPDELGEIFQPVVVSQIMQELTGSLANFYSYFITLHRAAFFSYPASPEVNLAVEEILKLAKMESSSVYDEEDQTEPQNQIRPQFLWPLFMCALECDRSDRIWILDQMRAWKGYLAENVSRIAAVIEKTCQRQELEKQRVDARSLKREMFGSDFSFIL